jgi:beta-glucanase (GH16 family)
MGTLIRTCATYAIQVIIEHAHCPRPDPLEGEPGYQLAPMKLNFERSDWRFCPAMKWLVVLVGLGCLSNSLAQRPAQGPMSPIRQTPEDMDYELVWQDDFNGNVLDPQKWEVRGIGPRALGFVSPEAVTVEDGYLKLRALKKDDRILLGAVGTQNRFMTRYGYFECRAQLQKSPGIWAAFWIQSTEISKGEDPAIYGAEIDIMEFFKKLGTDIVSHNVHWAYGPHQKTTHGMQSYVKGVSEGFHTFALEWTPEKYVFFVDGYRFYEVTTGISHIEEYLILSMEIPSEAREIKNTVFPDVFLVDYVKVYQKKSVARVRATQQMEPQKTK